MSDLKRVRVRRFLSVMSAASVLLVFAGVARSDPTPTDVFPGVYQLTVTPDTGAVSEGRQAFVDYVQFDNGNFTAEACAKLGFAPVAYVVKSLDGKTVFEVTLTSGTQGTQTWTGRRGVSSLVGSLTWTKPDGDVFMYAFTGQKTDVPTDPEADLGN